MGDITMTSFDKISDTLLYFSNDVTLSLCMQLNGKNKDGGIKNFHSEYHYTSSNLNKDSYSIKREIKPYFSINDLKDYKNSIMLKANDIWFLKQLINNKILPWFIGQTRIFFFDDNKQLQINGKWNIQEFKLNDYSFMAFAPIVIRYEDGTDKEGIRMLLNSKDRFVDISIDTFISFYYYISNTDLYNAGANMANYVKTMPYDIGIIDLNNGYNDNRYGYDDDNWNDTKNKSRNFFNK